MKQIEKLNRWNVILSSAITVGIFCIGFSLMGINELDSSHSPISKFRTILNWSPEERSQFVKKQPANVQRILERKIMEYEALSESQREFRLIATELHFYLDPLLVGNRNIDPSAVQEVPPHLRKYIDQSVGFWNRIKPAHRDLLLAKKEAVSYLISISSRLYDLEKLMPKPAPEWDNLYNFLQLPHNKQLSFMKAYQIKPSIEMEKLLVAFQGLEDEEKRNCAHAFVCYLSFPNNLKTQFVDGLAEWSQKKPSERSIWREIASKYPRIRPVPVPPGSNINQQAQIYPPFPVEKQSSSRAWSPAPPMPPLPR